MNKTTGFLVAVIIVLVGIVAYMYGQKSSDSRSGSDEKAGESAANTQTASKDSTRLPPKRDVRIGTDGPRNSACKGIAVVANLPETGGVNDYLAVRNGPSARSTQLDKLGNGHPVILCDQNESGTWIGIVYQNDGLPPGDRCEVIAPAPSTRAYDGPCQSGWVYSKYIEVARPSSNQIEIAR